jgi:DNA-binding beta-propeller fold protein YncE
MLNEKPLPFQLDRVKESPAANPLYFPGKILADAASNRLFVADSTHHRIVITDLAGKLIDVAGSGKEGKQDGKFDEASFSDPQGMALVGNKLYVADRKNHMIRVLDLKKKTVEVAAGTGEQDRFGRFKSGPALETGLNSPWDQLHHENKLYVAMAGHHQIRTLDHKKKEVAPFAGNGRENIADGALSESEFAQPSGLATDGTHLYVADCETSSIRSLRLDGTGEVSTLVGRGLFIFGDKEGVGREALLQHALGVAFRDGKLYVADTYNNKIKIIEPESKKCTTFALKASASEKGKVLNEPAGISFAGDKLYVADTNNHRVRVIDIKTGAVSTVTLEGLSAPKYIVMKEKK